MLLKILSILKLVILKLRFGKRLEIKSIRQNFRLGTEIVVGKNAFLSLGRVSFRTNVHLLCDLGEMHIGNRVVFNRNCIVACRQRINISDRCLFGPNVCIYDHDHAYSAEGVSPTEFKCSEIIIEDGCWIGAGAIILRGTHIGRNTIIEAGSVVKGIIPSDSIVTTIRETRSIPASFFTGKSKICSK
jgi:acetyltransferase-like isoleucine patch superfamily enzyme